MAEHILPSFVEFLCKEGLVAGTVKLYLAAIWHPQIALGFGVPTDYKHAQAGIHHEGAPEGFLDEGQSVLAFQ